MKKKRNYDLRVYGYINCAECGKEIRKRSSTHKYCAACRKKKRQRWGIAANLRKRKKVLGRECRWCGDTDDNGKSWSANRDECGACNRLRTRQACHWCGGPFFKVKSPTRGFGPGCIQQCEDLVEIERRERRRIRLLEEAERLAANPGLRGKRCS